jgi:hypothetical protein
VTRDERYGLAADISLRFRAVTAISECTTGPKPSQIGALSTQSTEKHSERARNSDRDRLDGGNVNRC